MGWAGQRGQLPLSGRIWWWRWSRGRWEPSARGSTMPNRRGFRPVVGGAGGDQPALVGDALVALGAGARVMVAPLVVVPEAHASKR